MQWAWRGHEGRAGLCGGSLGYGRPQPTAHLTKQLRLRNIENLTWRTGGVVQKKKKETPDSHSPGLTTPSWTKYPFPASVTLLQRLILRLINVKTKGKNEKWFPES